MKFSSVQRLEKTRVFYPKRPRFFTLKDPGLLECKHRGFQIQQMFRSMIELDFGKVGDRKCIIRRLLAGCGQYSKILSPVS